MAAAEPATTTTTTGMGFLGLLSFRRTATAVASFDPAQDGAELAVLDALQAHVADRLAALSSFCPAGAVLSLGFLSKLLDAVVTSDAAFREALLAVGAAAVSRHPADRLAADLLDRAVRALDVLNAVSLALASLRGSHRAALAAADCLLLLPAGNGGKPHRAHFARARRAISRLFPAAAAAPPSTPCSSRAARALSFSVSSKNWSSSSSSTGGAGRHVAAALPMPQGLTAAPGAGCGLGLALYTMSSVLAFAMWALTAAVPCPASASAAPLAPPKQAQWAAPMALLQDRIVEESRKKDNNNNNNNSKKGSSSSSSSSSSGLLAEMQAVERAARELNSLLEEIAEEEEDDGDDEPAAVGEDRAADVVERAEALAGACRALEDGLAPLERQVRAVFHRVVASRGEVVRCIEQSARSTAAGPASAGAPAPPQHHSF
ncbi:hypothetical protein BRADI_3g01050v3 [Brachypodium distachyon]|uniref:Uncharacterized protein n=2 Tax=Brachypodium distachyon TaxID=15368 RepID=I1HW77_BRADI|nr:hypothetical protein BRADI_3g01050v3 [Brachypodium distachyon]